MILDYLYFKTALLSSICGIISGCYACGFASVIDTGFSNNKALTDGATNDNGSGLHGTATITKTDVYFDSFNGNFCAAISAITVVVEIAVVEVAAVVTTKIRFKFFDVFFGTQNTVITDNKTILDLLINENKIISNLIYSTIISHYW